MLTVVTALEQELDLLVAKILGVKILKSGAGPTARYLYTPKRSAYRIWTPSTNWKQGGPIIEDALIYVMPGCGALGTVFMWDARIDDPEGEPWEASGPTPLIAAMRCFVLSRLGEEVEFPGQLV